MNPIDPHIILATILAALSSLLGPLNGSPTFHVTDDGLYAYDAPAGSYGLVDGERIPIGEGDTILDTSLDRADGYVEMGDDGAYVVRCPEGWTLADDERSDSGFWWACM